MKTLSSLLLLTATISAASFLPLTASAQATEVRQASSEKQAEAATTYRKSVLQLMSSNMGPLGAMAKGKIPMNAEVITKNAERIAFLAPMMHDYFSLDTSKFNLKTDAKDSIWSNHKDFSHKIDDLVTAANNLKMVGEKNDAGSSKKAIGAVGGSCKSCHDDYKKD
ncbi:cytochrome c [Colwellia sp. PAMC 21821]|uniref:c-type cytochrome n=1 Tax=Colwellia sp. PAMC 21821 TaxID=1816219 RepID=UPI0009BF2D9B|nr:cytochrome c [Colwellia sp. PAMC 21821]ARD43419.1 cytochrome C [Colwellia sp. PAMC 21821]